MRKRFSLRSGIALAILATVLLGLMPVSLAQGTESPKFKSCNFDPKTFVVSGEITDTKSPDKYGVVLFLYKTDAEGQEGWHVKPDLDHAVSPVGRNKKFSTLAIALKDVDLQEEDKKATKYMVFLVDKACAVIDANDLAAVEKIAYDSVVLFPPPQFDASSIRYIEKTHYVEGKVTGEFEGCGIILFIRVGGKWWVKPTLDDQMSRINHDGTFSIQAYSIYPDDARIRDQNDADSYALFLVKEDHPPVGINGYPIKDVIDQFEEARKKVP